MEQIKLKTLINAHQEICFDLSRDIDLHIKSMSETDEVAIDGVKSGLISKGETVTWSARHFGVRMKMTVKIVDMQFPLFFYDQQISGPFKSLSHQHFFERDGNQTLMIDVFEFESPFGPIGRLVDRWVMKKYMLKLLLKRSEEIKQFAERV